MDVSQLTHVDEVFALYQHREEFKEASNITLVRTQCEVISFIDELNFVFVDESFEFVVLEPVHEQFLVDSESFVVEQEDALQCMNDLTLLVVNEGHELLIVDVLAVERIFLIQLQAGFKSSIYYFSHQFGVGDEILVVESDLVEEVGCSHLLAKVGENVDNVVHQLLLAVEVVEAEESEVLVNCEEDLSVDIVDGLVLDNSDVLGQGVVYPLSYVHVLE